MEIWEDVINFNQLKVKIIYHEIEDNRIIIGVVKLLNYDLKVMNLIIKEI